MKGTLGIITALLGALAITPASAGTLYKCVGADGVPAYVSKRVAAAQCSVVSHYSPQAGRAPRITPATVVPTPAAAVASPPPASSAAPAVTAAASVPAPATIVSPAAAPRTVSGQVYSYMQDGVRHYSSRRPQGAAAGQVRTIAYSYIERCFACGSNSRINFGSVRLNTNSYRDEIAAAARTHGVEEAIVRAIIHAESAFNPTAVSRAGAQGLMQLMPATARRFGVSDSFDASQNISGGVKYLSWLLRRFNGNLTLAAAGYNAGEGAVDRHGGVPPYRETQHYVQRVAQLAERYRSEGVHAQ
jgi:soluble lytic murein transglycosylase-like protein